MYPVYLKMQNFLSFEDQEYTFSQDKAYLIQGVNNSKDNQSSNGAGKSSLQSAIEYAVAKTTSRKCRDIKLVRRGQKSPALVELHINCPMRKETLIIRRTIPLKGSTTCECWHNEVRDENKISLATVPDADKFIIQWLGIELKDIQNYFIINRERYKSFFKTSDTELLALFSRFSNTSPIDGMIDKVKKDVESKDLELQNLVDSKIAKEAEISLLEKQLNEEQERDIAEEIEVKKQSLLNKIHYQNVYAVFKYHYLTKYVDLKIDSYKAILSGYNTELGKLSDGFKKFNNDAIKDEISGFESQLINKNKLKKEAEDIKTDINSKLTSIQTKISGLNVVLGGKITCPNCKHEFLADPTKDLVEVKGEVRSLKTKQSKYNNDISETELVEKEVQNSIKSIKQSISDLELKEQANRVKRNSINSELDKVNKNISNIKLKINELEGSKVIISKQINNHTNINIPSINNQIKSLKNSFDNGEVITKLEDDIYDYKNSYKKIEEGIKVKQDEIFETKQWETNFKRFKSHIAKKSLLTIQSKINEQLKLMKSDMRVRLEGFKEKADGSLSEKITSTIIDNGDLVDFASLSGGERVRVDFACILTLQEIINSTHKYGGLNLLFVDEITEGIDPTGLALLMHSMPKNKSIFVITHIQMDSMYDDVLTIENNNGISTIKL